MSINNAEKCTPTHDYFFPVVIESSSPVHNPNAMDFPTSLHASITPALPCCLEHAWVIDDDADRALASKEKI